MKHLVGASRPGRVSARDSSAAGPAERRPCSLYLVHVPVVTLAAIVAARVLPRPTASSSGPCWA